MAKGVAVEHYPDLIPTTELAAKEVLAGGGKGLVGRINERIGLWITTMVGTMWCAYLFAGIVFLGLPSAIHAGFMYLILMWLSSSFLQLVLLPIIIVGQNIQNKAADLRAQATHEYTSSIMHRLDAIEQMLARPE
jgi:hypothetical protein